LIAADGVYCTLMDPEPRMRSDNRGENPPLDMQSLSGGLISGVAIDTTNSAWIADFDNGIVQGPFPLN
jgi:hypothetical protein